MMNGDYMNLLNLENEVAEECFRIAMERPLSPNLPEIGLCDFEREVEARILIAPISASNKARDQDGYSARNTSQLYCIAFSDMEDVGCITRILCATSTCIGCCWVLQTGWLMRDILAALLLEKDLKSREKVCVLFSLILLNFFLGYHLPSPRARSFLILFLLVYVQFSSMRRRDFFAKICDLSELLSLSEDFVLCWKILMQNDMIAESQNGCGSSFDILHEGEKIVLCPRVASTNLVVAGSTVLASITAAVGHAGFVCEVSWKMLLMCRDEYSSALLILHMFAYICGEEYFTIRDHCLVMKVVQAIVTFIESCLANNANMDIQPVDNTWPQFTPCVRCPFLERSVSLDHVSSELLEVLQRHDIPQSPAKLVLPSKRESLPCFLGDVLLSLELITSVTGWDWVCAKVLPKLFKMLKSGYQGSIISTVLVVLIGDLGRLGIEALGYDDAGVESILCHLLGLAATLNGDATLPMAIVYAIVGLYPRGHELLHKSNVELLSRDGHSASADIMRKFLFSLSGEQISSLVGLLNPDNIGVAV